MEHKSTNNALRDKLQLKVDKLENEFIEKSQEFCKHKCS